MLDHIFTETLLSMVRGSDETFTLLPQDVREIFNKLHCGTKKLTRHQIFGAGWRLQTIAEENEGNYLLLQITDAHDIVPVLSSGDIQFYITPTNLAAGRWETAFALAESD